MKKSQVFAILAMMLPMISQAHEAEEIELQKIYVDTSQIAFANGGIFAHIAGEWVPVDAIYSGAGGILAAIKKNPNIDRWTCSYCGYKNNSWDDTCQNLLGNKLCGRPRPW